MIIFFHSAYFEFFLALSNRFEFMNSINSLYYCLVISLHHAIDVFFLLSGFLMSFLTMKEMISKGEKFSLIKVFIRRVIRYLPVFYFLIGLERLGYEKNPPSVHLIVLESKKMKKLVLGGQHAFYFTT
jgi:peptidoglycan/LPS O-acetylase OafA/YrhL